VAASTASIAANGALKPRAVFFAFSRAEAMIAAFAASSPSLSLRSVVFGCAALAAIFSRTNAVAPPSQTPCNHLSPVAAAKGPLEAFRAAGDTTDEAVRANRMIEHAAKVRSHIDALGAKNYWEQFQPAPEFVVLFLPGDHFLTAALQADNLLMDRALSRRVLLATPTTLIALLKAASYGWRQESVSKNADEISALGRALYDRVAGFADNLDKIGRGLDTAMKGYNTAVGSFEGMLLPGARKLAELGAKGAKELTAPSTVDTAARDVVKPA